MFGTKHDIHEEIQNVKKSNNSIDDLERNINSVLPNEIFVPCILKHLDLKGLYNTSLTCKKWNNLVCSYFATNGNVF